MKYVGILSVGAVLVAGFAYYTLFAGPSLPAITEQSDSIPIPEVIPGDPRLQERQTFAGAGSLNNLRARNESLECQITYIPNPQEPEVTGSFFTANGQVRGDFLVPTPDLNGQMVSSVIFDGTTLYSWTEIDGETYGFQIATDSFFSSEDNEATPVPTDIEIQYNCLTWPAVDRTIFQPPTNILFTDLTDFTATMETGLIFEDGEF